MDAAIATKEKRVSAEPGPIVAKSFWKRHEHALLGTISMLVFLSFWEASVAFGWVNPLFTSSPSRIVRTAIEMFADGSILVDMQVSGYEFIVGYGAAIVIGGRSASSWAGTAGSTPCSSRSCRHSMPRRASRSSLWS